MYDKVSGELIGYVNLSDMTQHLLELEQQLVSSAETTQSLAATVFVFMVRGLFNNLKFPYEPSLPQRISFCHSTWKSFLPAGRTKRANQLVLRLLYVFRVCLFVVCLCIRTYHVCNNTSCATMQLQSTTVLTAFGGL